jgi:hypothetical protein
MAINFIEDVQVVGSLSISGDGSNSATLTESASGDFEIHAQDDLRLNANGHDIVLKGASNEFGRLSNDAQNFVIKNIILDKDIIFKGNDGGSTIDALTLDMSDGGNATFSGAVGIGTVPAASVELHVNGDVRVDATDGVATRKIRSSYFSSATDIRVESGSSADVILGDNSAARLTLASTGDATFAGDVATTGLAVSSSNNTLATFTSTDDIAKFTLADDDTTAYFGVKDSILNIGLNSTVTSNENLEIRLDGSKQYMGFGGAPSSTFRFNLKHDVSTNDDVSYTNFRADFNVSGSTAVSADRTYRAIYADLDSTSTSGDTADEVRLYGIESNVVDSGDADLLYGVYSFARNNRTTAGDNVTNVVAGRFQTQTSNTAGTVTNSKGVHASAQADNAGGTMSQMYGGHFEATQTADSDKVIGNVYGVFGKVDTTTGGGGGMFTNTDGGRFEIEMEVNGATMSNARAVHGILDINNGTVSNGYQFYGSSAIAAAGAITNHYGIYSIGADKNYIEGTLQLGSYGSGSQTGTSAYYLIANSSGNIIEKTPAQVRADIGAGTGSGTIDGSGTGTYIPKFSDSDTITSSGMFQAASNNFSIGVTTPNATLSVSGDFSIGTSSTDVLRLHNEAGVGTIDGYSTRSIAIGSTTNGEVMRVDNTNQRIGIGTSSPSYKLHVDGHALISAEKYYYVAGAGAGMGSDASGNLILRQDSADLMTTSGSNATFAGDIAVGPKSNATVQVSESGNSTVKMLAGSVGRVGTYSNHNLNLMANSNTVLTLDTSQNATFAAAVTLNGTDGHINLDGNNAAIFDNSNNNNAYYIRNGGTNVATLQIGTGSPGSNIKLTLDGSGNATYAGTISATVNADDATYTGIVTVDSGTLKYRTKAEILSDIGAGTGSGTVTEVTVGTGLDVSNGTTTPNITLDLTELSNATGAMTNNDRFIIDSSGGSSFKMTPSLIPLSIMNNDAGFTTNTGTVTGTASTNQIAYWSSSSGITGESGLTYSAAQDKLIFSGDYAIRDNNGTFELNTDGSDINTKINGFGGSGSLNLGENTVYTAASGFYVPSGYGISAGTTATASGTIRATGNIIAYYSDERLKNFQGNIPNALDKVCQLNGYYYKQNKKASDLGFDNEERQVGVSAQEVEKVLPEVIETAPISYNTDEDYLTVDYGRLVPLLIESIKELKNEIEILKNK